MKFRFTLQSVHDLRETRREEAERELARAYARLTDAHARLDGVIETRLAYERDCASLMQNAPLDPADLAARSDYLSSLLNSERAARGRIAELEGERDRLRQHLVEATRNCEVTSTLRERQRSRFEFEASRREQLMLDELATLGAARRQQQQEGAGC
ncbi:MAG: flagellar export protein FliJ [Pyrinomonadaceae bacterium]